MLDIESPLAMALAYAGHGWAVFPLHTWSREQERCDCRKPCAHPGKHPRTLRGFKDASTDPGRIREWWGMWPQANIGIATGAVSGIVVVDVDPRSGGMETAAALAAPLIRTAQVLTQHGGFHLYYAYFGKVKGGLGKGVDVQGDGKYVVAPPSVGEYGARYIWQVAIEPVAL